MQFSVIDSFEKKNERDRRCGVFTFNLRQAQSCVVCCRREFMEYTIV